MNRLTEYMSKLPSQSWFQQPRLLSISFMTILFSLGVLDTNNCFGHQMRSFRQSANCWEYR